MNGNEFLKRIRALAKQRGLTVTLQVHRGKGSHAKLIVGEHSTTLKDRRKEIGKGLLNSMLADLGLDAKDF